MNTNKFRAAARLTLASAFVLTAAACSAACKKSVNYYDYVSEYRKNVFIYEDDGYLIKVYNSIKETPYALDGVKGVVGELTEVYFSCEARSDEVEIELLGKGGEMSWLAVSGNYYLSFSGGDGLDDAASLPVTVTVDGKSQDFIVPNAKSEGCIDGKSALDCVLEYDGGTFKNLTDGTRFSGEICLRLIYDGGCYYYVGVCDREKQVHAYLVDGTDGRIIAERQSEAEK